jgi:hypothetical protein
MFAYWFTALVAGIALLTSIGLFVSRWGRMRRLPFGKDLSEPKDSASHGILYAFTAGMVPWAKESTRLHWIGYMRGVVFHLGIFVGLGSLLISPWLDSTSPLIRTLLAMVTGTGAVMGVVGGIMRITEHNLKSASTPDDHFSVWLVSLFLTTMTLALISTQFSPFMYVVATAMLLYAPLGKIRHCIYFYFGRLFFGLHIGRRGIVRGLEVHND